MNNLFIHKLDTQQQGQVARLHPTDFHPIQLLTVHTPHPNAPNVGIGERKPLEPCSAEIGLRQVALYEFGPLQPARVERRAVQSASGEADRPGAHEGENRQPGLATLEHDVLQRGLGEVRAQQLALGEDDAVEARFPKVGVRQIAITEDHVVELCAAQIAGGEKTSRESAGADGEAFPLKRRHCTPERAAVDLLGRGQQRGISVGKSWGKLRKEGVHRKVFVCAGPVGPGGAPFTGDRVKIGIFPPDANSRPRLFHPFWAIVK